MSEPTERSLREAEKLFAPIRHRAKGIMGAAVDMDAAALNDEAQALLDTCYLMQEHFCRSLDAAREEVSKAWRDAVWEAFPQTQYLSVAGPDLAREAARLVTADVRELVEAARRAYEADYQSGDRERTMCLPKSIREPLRTALAKFDPLPTFEAVRGILAEPEGGDDG